MSQEFINQMIGQACQNKWTQEIVELYEWPEAVLDFKTPAL